MSAENLFGTQLKVINVGLQSFAQDLRSVGVECRQVTIDTTEPERPGADNDGTPSAEKE